MSHNKYKLPNEKERLDNEAFLKECIRIEGILLSKSKPPPQEPPILEETTENTVIDDNGFTEINKPTHTHIGLEKTVLPNKSVGKLNMSFT